MCFSDDDVEMNFFPFGVLGGVSVVRMFFVDNGDLSPSNSQGRLAVEYNGTTGYYCSYSAVHNNDGPSTLCHLMGFPRGGEKLDMAVAARLPDLNTYPKGWNGELHCGEWDRDVHFLSCFSYWQQEEIYSMLDVFDSSSAASLSHCGQNVPAISCFKENCELLCYLVCVCVCVCVCV